MTARDDLIALEGGGRDLGGPVKVIGHTAAEADDADITPDRHRPLEAA